MSESDKTIDTLLEERRTFAPSAEFRSKARVTDQSLHEAAEADPEAFWEEQAKKHVSWYRPFDKVLEWDLPFAKWFLGGKLNVSYNCVDRHVEAGTRRQGRLLLGGRAGATRRTITYADLLPTVVPLRERAPQRLGVKGDPGRDLHADDPGAADGDARLRADRRAAHWSSSAASRADALSGRMNDVAGEALITADEGWRRGSNGAAQADRRRGDARRRPTVKHVPRRAPHRQRRADDRRAATTGGTSVVGDEPGVVPARADGRRGPALPALHVRHDRQAEGHRAHDRRLPARRDVHARLRLRPQAGHDVYWCAADIGWVTGHSYIVYGPLCNGATSVIYEGTPDFPDKDRWWEIVERYKVTILYTRPDGDPDAHEVGPGASAGSTTSRRLRLLGPVGEPINPEAWIWYREHIGGDRTPIVDTWWQTETGAIMITPLPGSHDAQAGLGDASRFPASTPASSTSEANRSAPAAAATSC